MSNATELLRRALEALHFDLSAKESAKVAEEICTYLASEKEAEPVGRQSLTDEELRGIEKEFHAERIRTSDEEYLVIYPADYWDWQRAIEKAVQEKNPPPRPEPARKPMTEREIMDLAKSFGFDDISTTDFAIGFRFAEKHHGIGGSDE